MAWFLRAIELSDGRWACRWGGTEYDRHDSLDDAVSHLLDLSREMAPSSIRVHRIGMAPVAIDSPEG